MGEPYIAMSTSCPACAGRCELEEEDGLRKWVCTDQDGCGFEFGHVQVTQFESSCSLGIPEEVRRQASLEPLAGRSITIENVPLTDEGRRVFLGGIGRRPE